MKRSRLFLPTAFGLLAATLVPATAASAANASAATAPAVRGPEIALIGDLFVDGTKGVTDDRTPRIWVDSLDSAHDGARLIVRDAATGQELCTGDDPVSGFGDLYAAGCSTSKLHLGVTRIEAAYVTADGSTEAVSEVVDLHVVPQHFDLGVTAYDRATDVATLTGTGPAGETINVGQDLDFGGPSVEVTVPQSGRWTTTVTNPADLGFESRFESNGKTWYGVTYFRKDAPLKPAVQQRLEGSQVIVEVTSGETVDRIEIRDRDQRVVASGGRTGTVTTLSFRAPAGEASYAAQVFAGDKGSVMNWFTVQRGEGAPVSGAPDVTDVSRAGSRAVVKASAEAGSVVTVTNADDQVVARRLVGASGATQVTVPVGGETKADAPFFISQSKDGATSERDDFTVPAVK